MKTKFIALLTCLIVLSANVFSQNGKWKKARKINTVETYEKFLEKYPESQYKFSAFELIDSIKYNKIDIKNLSELRTFFSIAKSDNYKGKSKADIDKLENESWNLANRLNTNQSYQKYIEDFPSGKYADNANQNVDELDWASSLKDNTVEAFKRYIKSHPSGKYTGNANQNIDELDWASSLKDNTVEAFERYIEFHPVGLHSKECNNKIDSAYWYKNVNNSKNNLNYIAYLKKFPNGKYANEANNYLKTPIYNAKNQIDNFNRAFGKEVKFTDEQVITYIERLQNETYSTTINSPVTYYKVSGTRCNETTVKTKELIQPEEIGKACSLKLEFGDLPITISYSSNPSIKHPLFINKRSAKMTHNGCSGPGLELASESQAFLRAFAIEYHMIAGGSGNSIVVIPDLIWKADETAGYGHNGEIFNNTNEIIKIEGLKCDIAKIPETKMSYKMALEIKTYIETIAKD